MGYQKIASTARDVSEWAEVGMSEAEVEAGLHLAKGYVVKYYAEDFAKGAAIGGFNIRKALYEAAVRDKSVPALVAITKQRGITKNPPDAMEGGSYIKNRASKRAAAAAKDSEFEVWGG